MEAALSQCMDQIVAEKKNGNKPINIWPCAGVMGSVTKPFEDE